MINIIILLFVLLIFSYILMKIKLRNAEKHLKSIPGRSALPFLGNMLDILGMSSLEELFNWVESLKQDAQERGITKVWFGPIYAVAVFDPNLIETISNSPHATNKGCIYSLIFGDILNGVFTLSGGPAWKELRRPVTKSMKKKLLEKNYFNTFVKKSKDFCDFIKQERHGVYYNVISDSGRLLLDIFSETHLGIHLNELKENKWNLMKNFDVFLELKVSLIMRFHFYFYKYAVNFTKFSERFNGTIKEFNNFLQWILNERRITEKQIDGEEEYYPDFLLRRAAEKKLTDSDIRKELGDIVIAGSDTSASLLSSVLVFLGMFPEYQEKAYQEQVDILGGTARDPTFEDLTTMVYLDQVIKETLRIVSPPGIVKTCDEDLLIGEYTIPKGCIIYINIRAVQLSHKYWEKPMEFYPDHFLPEKEAARPRCAYQPFGIGQRFCPGYQYGFYVAKVLIAAILRRYRISTNIKLEDIKWSYKLFCSITNGYIVKFEER